MVIYICSLLKRDLLLSLLCKEQWEQLAHGRSFLKSDESECSQLLFKESNFEQKREFLTLEFRFFKRVVLAGSKQPGASTQSEENIVPLP